MTSVVHHSENTETHDFIVLVFPSGAGLLTLLSSFKILTCLNNFPASNESERQSLRPAGEHLERIHVNAHLIAILCSWCCWGDPGHFKYSGYFCPTFLWAACWEAHVVAYVLVCEGPHSERG